MAEDRDRDEFHAEDDGLTEAERLRHADEQFQLAKMAMRGMYSDAWEGGEGEFLEPVRIPSPVNPIYPEDVAILEAATSLFNVSADPSIATPIDTGTSEPYLDQEVQVPEPEAPVIPEMEDVPGIDPPETPDPQVDISEIIEPTSPVMVEPPQMAIPDPSSPSMETPEAEDLPQQLPRTPVPEPVAPVDGQPARSRFTGNAPGAPAERGGREGLASGARERIQAGRQASPQAPAPGAQRQARAAPGQPAAQPSRSAPREPMGLSPPPRQDFQAGPVAEGPLPEFGGMGSTFYQDTTAGQVNLNAQAAEAVDAIDNNMELIVELLRRLTLNQMRHRETLAQLVDKADSEDEADEF